MKNRQARIEQVKEEAIQVFYKIYHNKANGYVPCVFIQQLSPRKCHIGWRFTKQGTQIGDIQKDSHVAYDPKQEIVWVWGVNSPGTILEIGDRIVLEHDTLLIKKGYLGTVVKKFVPHWCSGAWNITVQFDKAEHLTRFPYPGNDVRKL